eukprot:2841996-Rhodomonas_salina.1
MLLSAGFNAVLSHLATSTAENMRKTLATFDNLKIFSELRQLRSNRGTQRNCRLPSPRISTTTTEEYGKHGGRMARNDLSSDQARAAAGSFNKIVVVLSGHIV